jgi:hypothetical protein
MKDNPTPNSFPFVLRDLPFAARLTLAVFLLCVGVGYFAAIVQLHLQHASPGEIVPTADDAVKIFHGPTGAKPLSKLEALLEADENLKWNGTGQMSAAFTRKSEGWKSAIKEKAKELNKERRGGELDLDAAEKALRKERDTERLAILAWIKSGASKAEYQQDCFPLSGDLAGRVIDSKYVAKEGNDKTPPSVKVKSILTDRCVRCHGPEGEDAQATNFPLDTYDRLKPYVTVKTATTGMSLEKLAQSSHVHLLGFSMLYGLTGLIFAFSSYPRLLRVLLSPLPLLAQVIDISFWWLARMDEPYGPEFARAIVISGAVVGAAVGLQIVLSLFNLFGKGGKLLLILLFAAAAYGGYVAQERVIAPYIAKEKAGAIVVQQD